jgi:hypothetical protein
VTILSLLTLIPAALAIAWASMAALSQALLTRLEAGVTVPRAEQREVV